MRLRGNANWSYCSARNLNANNAASNANRNNAGSAQNEFNEELIMKNEELPCGMKFFISPRRDYSSFTKASLPCPGATNHYKTRRTKTEVRGGWKEPPFMPGLPGKENEENK